MKRNSTTLLMSAILLFAISLVAQDFDDQTPVKKVQNKPDGSKKTEEVKTPEPAKAEESKPLEESEPSKKNLYPGLSEDEAFDELLKNIRAGNLDRVESLISSFPKLLDKQDKFGHTPVFIAVSANQYQIVETLVKMKADIRLANIYGDTPFHKAAQSGEIKTLELLLKSGALIWKNNVKEESPLAKAVSAGQLEAVKFLIKNKAKLNTPDYRGDTPLHKAAIKGDNEMVKLLLESGAEAGIKNKEKMKAADLAKKSEIKEMIEAKDPALKK